MFNVVGIGNVRIPSDFQKVFQDKTVVGQLAFNAPNAEYRLIGNFVGNFFQTLRTALGDFAIIDSVPFINR